MKKLNEKQAKILNISVTVIQILAVLLAIILSSIVLANPKVDSATVGKGNIKLLPVLSDSMKGGEKDSFITGDLVIAKKPKDAEDLTVGDIITYKMTVDGSNVLNTHRIVRKGVTTKGEVYYNTKGDNNNTEDTGFVFASDVLAVYQYHIKGVGKAINWLQKPTNFLLVIVLPLALLFIYNIILFVQMLMQAKISKLKAAGETAVIDEEALKRKAVEEYLAAQNAEKKDAAEETKEE